VHNYEYHEAANIFPMMEGDAFGNPRRGFTVRQVFGNRQF
jgi:hypothetical protein